MGFFSLGIFPIYDYGVLLDTLLIWTSHTHVSLSKQQCAECGYARMVIYYFDMAGKLYLADYGLYNLSKSLHRKEQYQSVSKIANTHFYSKYYGVN